MPARLIAVDVISDAFSGAGLRTASYCMYWLLEGTPVENEYREASVLIEE